MDAAVSRADGMQQHRWIGWYLRKNQVNLVFHSVCTTFFVNEESTSVRKCSN